MIRPLVACRAMWCRANSPIIRAAPIASTMNYRVQVAAVTGWSDRPSRSAVAAAKVSASHPVALLTRMSTGPNCSSAASNSFLAWPLGQVGFYGGCLPPPSRMRPTTAVASWAR